MKFRIDRKILLIISCIWFVAVLIPFLLVLHSIKFSVIENIFSICLIFIMPILGIIFSIIPDKIIKPVIYVLLILCFALYSIYIIIATYGFTEYQTPFYPISMSATEKSSDYLILDNLGEFNEDLIIKNVFPDSIPLDATDISYSYECEPYKFALRVNASWNLPEEQYYKEQQRISEMSKKKIEQNGTVYYDVSTEKSYCHVAFTDEGYSVEYVDILGYYYDYRKISGIGDWK